MRVFSASVVVPVTAPAITDGAVAVRDGSIIDVGVRDLILRKYSEADETAFEGVMIPGLVNAHTHLQFTAFSHVGASPYPGFEEWSVAFDVEYSTNGGSQDWLGSATLGAEMALRSGTTTIADICTDLAAFPALGNTGLSGIVYLEVLGNTSRQWFEEGRDDFIAKFEETLELGTDRVKIGISPHAPYSLDTEVLIDLARLSRQYGVRLHTHLAESAYEDQYCRVGTGPLADFVAGFGRDFEILVEQGTGMGTAEFTQSTGLLGAATHVAHGIYLDAAGRDLLRREGSTVALCPRSNATIGLSPPPVAAYLEEGNHIAVGTDSLSSSPSLDLIEDVALLYELARDQGYDRPDLAHRLLAAATQDGARALGLDDRVGSIAQGKDADFAVFAIDSGMPEESVVVRGAGQCAATVLAGEVVPTLDQPEGQRS